VTHTRPLPCVAAAMRKRRQTTAPAAARPPRHVAPIRPGPPGALTLPDDCAVLYRPAFLSAAAADALFAATVDAAAWSRTPITFFGQQVLQPRDTAFYGTELYSYSDERRAPLPWGHDAAGEAIRALKFRVEGELGLERDYFNVCLCNRYPDGQSYMGYHSDGASTPVRRPGRAMDRVARWF
jgi:alkylated DNA repair dioxygenase AlkB